ncbi:MAG: hypothetical protein ACXWUF_20360, partial [Methylomagnum sp.]
MAVIVMACHDLNRPRFPFVQLLHNAEQYREYFQRFSRMPNSDRVSSEILYSLEKARLIRRNDGQDQSQHNKGCHWGWARHQSQQLFPQSSGEPEM